MVNGVGIKEMLENRDNLARFDKLSTKTCWI